MRHLPPLLEEFLVAAAAMTVLGAIIAVVFWLVTGLSPWPHVILAEISAFGWGTVMLTLAAPRRSP
jgi:uncharacterized RDD family membrane protein YckC